MALAVFPMLLLLTVVSLQLVMAVMFLITWWRLFRYLGLRLQEMERRPGQLRGFEVAPPPSEPKDDAARRLEQMMSNKK